VNPIYKPPFLFLNLTKKFRLEVTSEDVLTDDLLDLALQNLQESGALNVDGALTIMQRYVKDSGISIKTHFASHQNDCLNFPRRQGPWGSPAHLQVSAPQTPTTNWKIKPLYGTLATSLKGTGSH
jgi:hypothetical protein